MSDEEKEELVAGYILSDGNIISSTEMLEKAEESTLIPEDPFGSAYGLESLIEPPYNVDQLAQLLEINAVHYRCCKQKAADASGLGWNLLDDEKGADPATKKLAEDFLKTPSDMPLRLVLEALILDHEAVGYCGIEVVRNALGGIDKLYHIPAKTIRVHAAKDKFCQLRDIRKVWFKPFGDPRTMRNTDGAWLTGPESSLLVEEQANEIIFVKKYHPRSDYYGLPDIIPALGALMGDLARRDYNLQFFDNNAVPQYAIILKGAQLSDQLKELIKTYFTKEVKGKAHSTLVLPVPGGSEVDIKFEKLATDTKDASFREYRQDNIDEILIAHGVPPYRVGLAIEGSLGGNTAEESTRIYKAGIVEPLQETFESIINEKILEQGLGITGWTFKFNELDAEDKDAAHTRDWGDFDRGALTSNQMRERHDLGDPYPGGESYYILAGAAAAPVGNEAPVESMAGDVVRPFVRRPAKAGTSEGSEETVYSSRLHQYRSPSSRRA